MSTLSRRVSYIFLLSFSSPAQVQRDQTAKILCYTSEESRKVCRELLRGKIRARRRKWRGLVVALKRVVENFPRRMETSPLFPFVSLLFFLCSIFLFSPCFLAPLSLSCAGPLPLPPRRSLRKPQSTHRVARNKTRFLWDGNFICFRDACSRKRTSHTSELRSGTGSRSLPLLHPPHCFPSRQRERFTADKFGITRVGNKTRTRDYVNCCTDDVQGGKESLS